MGLHHRFGVWMVAAAGVAAGCGTGSAGSPAGRGAVYGSLGESSRGGYEVREARADEPERGGLAMAAQEGSLDREDAEAAIQGHWNRLVRCYERAGDARDFAGGPVTLRWVVGTDGRPLGVHVMSSSLGSFEVERCLVEIAAAVRFRRPHGHGKASVEYSMEFRASGEVPVVELGPASVEAAMPVVLGRLAEQCQQLGVDEVTATLYLDRKGAVRSVGFGSRQPFPADSAACVARTLRELTIPAGVQGAAVGRTVLALRESDLRHPPKLVRKVKKQRTTQGRRSPGRR